MSRAVSLHHVFEVEPDSGRVCAPLADAAP